jgi:hypothetical protein
MAPKGKTPSSPRRKVSVYSDFRGIVSKTNPNRIRGERIINQERKYLLTAET